MFSKVLSLKFLGCVILHDATNIASYRMTQSPKSSLSGDYWKKKMFQVKLLIWRNLLRSRRGKNVKCAIREHARTADNGKCDSRFCRQFHARWLPDRSRYEKTAQRKNVANRRVTWPNVLPPNYIPLSGGSEWFVHILRDSLRGVVVALSGPCNALTVTMRRKISVNNVRACPYKGTKNVGSRSCRERGLHSAIIKTINGVVNDVWAWGY